MSAPSFFWLDIVPPRLDAAAAVPPSRGRLRAGVRAVVMDIGCRDESAVLTRHLGATVIPSPVRGYGSARPEGSASANAPVVTVFDCDASADLSEATRGAGAVRDGSTDLVTGRRRVSSAGAWPVHARVAVAGLTWVLRRFGVDLRDLGPVRIAAPVALRALLVGDRRSGYPLKRVLRAFAAGWRIQQVRIGYAPPVWRSKVTGTVSGTFRAVRDMPRVLAVVPGDSW